MEVQVQILKEEYKEAIKKYPYLKGEIAAKNKTSTWTVDRWRRDNDPMLTTATNLAIIRTYLELDENIVLTEAVEPGKQEESEQGSDLKEEVAHS